MRFAGYDHAQMSQYHLSRRNFLRGSSAIAIGSLMGELLRAAEPAAPPAYPDQFQIDNGLVVLPSKGRLYIASDFHTRHADFQKWLTKTSIVQRLKNEPDTYGLILGDVLDVKPGDPHAEKGGDMKILDRIREIQTSLGKDGRRFIFILGNHESEVARIYGILKTHFALNAANRQRLIAALYNCQDGLFYQQFNAMERINDEQVAYLRTLPVGVLCKNGLICTHAGPAKSAKSPKDLATKLEPVVEDLVWSRPAEIAEIPGKGYSPDQLSDFLKMMEFSGLLVTGHTPLGSLPPTWLKNNVGVYGDKQLILATSYGSEPCNKSYLIMDLAKRYDAVADVAPGKELQVLEEKPAAKAAA